MIKTKKPIAPRAELSARKKSSASRPSTLSSQLSTLNSSTHILLVAVWLGLFVGLVEAAYLASGKMAIGRMNFVPDWAYWMAPVAHAAAYTLAVLPIWFFVRKRSSSGAINLAVTFTTALAWIGLLALIPGLKLYAHLLLAAGLAAATGRAFNRFREAALTAVEQTAPWLAAAVVLIAVGQQAIAWERNAQSAPAVDAASEDRPNVLFIVLDTLRADALAAYGGAPEDAQFLNRLADENLVFERAYATAPWTLPSTASMFTGRLPFDLSTGWDEPLDGAYPTVAEVLAENGYATAGFVANTRYCGRETGLARGFGHYEDYRFHPAHLALSTAIGRRFMTTNVAPLCGIDNDLGRITAEDVNRRFLDWLSAKDGKANRDAPFFAFLNYYDVHHPYTAPAPFARHAPKDLRQRKIFLHWWWVHKEHVEDHECRQQRAAYLDCLRYLDSQLEALFAELERRGTLENTIVIITSDHGEHFGEHGLYLHGNSLYEPLVHVPLVVVVPDRFAARYGDAKICGSRCDVPVSLAALPTTILELTGIARTDHIYPSDAPLAADVEQVQEDVTGPFPLRSLMQIWWKSKMTACEDCQADAAIVHMQVKGPPGGPLPCQGHSPVAGGEMEATITGHIKRIRHADGHEEVYDLVSDPAEAHDLSEDVLSKK
jgi:arylsulfatase A-like enzyme